MKDKKDTATRELPGFSTVEPQAGIVQVSTAVAAPLVSGAGQPRQRPAARLQHQLDLLDATDASGLPPWQREAGTDLTGLPLWAAA